ncbi:MAG: sigma 54-interacting transcriptional regulator [Tissierellia bacterium]|nr:sigma 54-interacting transcriptional regulator [Tissierellia bacterium]
MILFKESTEITEARDEIEELKLALNSLKDVLDNAYQGFVLVNEEGIIIKWNYEKLFGIKEEDALGKHVEDVIENTRLHIVIKTGKKELYDVQRIQGHDMIASRTPVFKDGIVIGAVGTVLFKDIKEVTDLAKRLKILENTVDKYKSEISKMYHSNYGFEDIITQNVHMLELIDIAKKAANSGSTILIEGESGTGKEYFAHAFHEESNRRLAPFIRINCAAIPHELLESELFGYEAGAFTGAKKEGKIGKLELANGGTVLLDEISSMPMSMQAKLLRVLEEREFERIGGNTSIRIDIRLIACTNENIEQLANKNKFRQDLYYRLNVVKIKIPPLRDRLDDIPCLCDDILNNQIQSMGLTSKTVTDRAIFALKLYNWPGNVRELRNILERAANVSIGNYIDIQHLPDFISEKLNDDVEKPNVKTLKYKLAEAEVHAIIEALKYCDGNRTEAAKLLGIHRTALYKKLESYGIDIKTI